MMTGLSRTYRGACLAAASAESDVGIVAAELAGVPSLDAESVALALRALVKDEA